MDLNGSKSVFPYPPRCKPCFSTTRLWAPVAETSWRRSCNATDNLSGHILPTASVFSARWDRRRLALENGYDIYHDISIHHDMYIILYIFVCVASTASQMFSAPSGNLSKLFISDVQCMKISLHRFDFVIDHILFPLLSEFIAIIARTWKDYGFAVGMVTRKTVLHVLWVTKAMLYAVTLDSCAAMLCWSCFGWMSSMHCILHHFGPFLHFPHIFPELLSNVGNAEILTQHEKLNSAALTTGARSDHFVAPTLKQTLRFKSVRTVGT